MPAYLDKVRLTSILKIPLDFEPWNFNFRAAMINNYGAAGSNAAALLCQEPYLSSQMVRGTMAQNQEYPILLSAASRNSLLMGVATLDKYLKDMDSRIAIGDLAFTLSEKRAHFQYRWAIIVSDIDTLRQSLKAAEKTNRRTPTTKEVGFGLFWSEYTNFWI